MKKYNYKEAFCICEYKSKSTGEIILIYNPQDQKVDLTIRVKGEEFIHVNHGRMIQNENHQPKEGDLIFRPMTQAEVDMLTDLRIQKINDSSMNRTMKRQEKRRAEKLRKNFSLMIKKENKLIVHQLIKEDFNDGE